MTALTLLSGLGGCPSGHASEIEVSADPEGFFEIIYPNGSAHRYFTEYGFWQHEVKDASVGHGMGTIMNHPFVRDDEFEMLVAYVTDLHNAALVRYMAPMAKTYRRGEVEPGLWLAAQNQIEAVHFIRHPQLRQEMLDLLSHPDYRESELHQMALKDVKPVGNIPEKDWPWSEERITAFEARLRRTFTPVEIQDFIDESIATQQHVIEDLPGDREFMATNREFMVANGFDLSGRDFEEELAREQKILNVLSSPAFREKVFTCVRNAGLLEEVNAS